MATSITTIRELCGAVGMSAEDVERVIVAVSGFYDPDLQIRAAQALADAWKEDRQLATVHTAAFGTNRNTED